MPPTWLNTRCMRNKARMHAWHRVGTHHSVEERDVSALVDHLVVHAKRRLKDAVDKRPSQPHGELMPVPDVLERLNRAISSRHGMHKSCYRALQPTSTSPTKPNSPQSTTARHSPPAHHRDINQQQSPRNCPTPLQWRRRRQRI